MNTVNPTEVISQSARLGKGGGRTLARPGVTRVSIVTPSYNQAPFLRRTIESVLNQTYKNIDYIVVDGGSTDGSIDVLRSYDARVRWISEPDRGQTHAINKGFALSSGQIRAYVNSDDTLLLDAVERVVDFLYQNPECDMIYGDANYIDNEDQVTGKYPTAEYSFSRLMFDCCVCQPAAFWRADIAAAVGPFDESFEIAMDYDYWLRIARAGGTIVHLRRVLANSRRYPETKTLSRREQAYAETFRTCRKHGGYVSISYLFGRWQSLWLTERSKFLARRAEIFYRGLSLIGRAYEARARCVQWFKRLRQLALSR